MKKVYLYGAGGHAKVILDILQTGNIMVAEFFDDNPELGSFMGIPVTQVIKYPLIISIGNNEIRKKIAEGLPDTAFAKAISVHSVISASASAGSGSAVMQGAVLQSCTRVGRHVIINTSASVDHDCVIGDFAHIAPGARLCGNVEVGEGCLIGAGSVVLPGIRIGEWSIIGAGSVVTENIPAHVVAAGSPCRIKHNK